MKRRISNWYLYFHTPTSNIIFTHTNKNVFVIEHGKFRIEESMMNIFLNKSLFDYESSVIQSNTKCSLPNTTHRLLGTGGNTYFRIDKTEKSHLFRIRRYSEYGDLEIDDIFQLQSIGFNINKPFEFSYISNGIAVKIKQEEKVFTLKNIKYQNLKPIQSRSLKQKLWSKV